MRGVYGGGGDGVGVGTVLGEGAGHDVARVAVLAGGTDGDGFLVWS